MDGSTQPPSGSILFYFFAQAIFQSNRSSCGKRSVISLLKFCLCKIKMCILIVIFFLRYYYVMLLFSAGRLCFPPLVQSMGGDKTTNDQLVELNT